MRSSVAFLLLLLVLGGASAQEPQHRIAFGAWVGHLDFHRDLRFDDDMVYELGLGYEFLPWLDLDLSLSQMRMWDRAREAWSQSVGFSMHWVLRPPAFANAGLGGLLGVSFVGFTEDENSDAIAEGLDVGLAWRHRFAGDWQLSAQAVGRLQSFNIVRVDAGGVALDQRDETGYLWSRLLRVGVGRAF